MAMISDFVELKGKECSQCFIAKDTYSFLYEAVRMIWLNWYRRIYKWALVSGKM